MDSRATRIQVIQEIWVKFVKEKVASALKLNQKVQKNKEKFNKAYAIQNN